MEFNTGSWLVDNVGGEVNFEPIQIKTKRHVTHKRKNPNYLSINQLEKLFKAMTNARDSLICLLAFSSGFRRAEVLSLKVKDIDWDKKTVMLNETKGGERKPVTIRPWVIPILKKWVRVIGQDSSYLFPSTDFRGGHLFPEGWYKTYRGILKKAGLWIEDHKKNDGATRHSYTFHTLRHSFCTYLLESGVSPAKVQKLMRHSKLKTTMQHYSHVRDPVAAEACDEAFSLKKKKPSMVSMKELDNEINDPIFQLKSQLVKNKITAEEFKEKIELLKMADCSG
jgi:integrase